VYNALSFNMEDYFSGPSYQGQLSDVERHHLAGRLEFSMDAILEQLENQGVRATFFVTGDVARQYGRLIRSISESNHEVSAGLMRYQHLVELSPAEFQKQLQQSKTLLEDIIGRRVVGFRASAFSMVRQTLWALDIIAELGFDYDSSVFPVAHEQFGIDDADPHLHYASDLEEKGILEFPPLTACFLNFRFPIGGSPYMRFIPTSWVVSFIHRSNRNGRPALISFNTWEFDSAQPRLLLPWAVRISRYFNLNRTKEKLGYLLKRHQFAPICEVIRTCQIK